MIDFTAAEVDGPDARGRVAAWLPLGPGWVAYARLLAVGVEYQIAEIRAVPGEVRDRPTRWTGAASAVTSRGLPISWLHRLNASDVIAAVRHAVGDVATSTDDLDALKLKGWRTDPDVRGRVALTALRFHQLPKDSVRNTNEVIAEQEGRGRRAQQIAEDLRKARDLGFLTKPRGRGMREGQLTSKGKREVYRVMDDMGADEWIEGLGITGWKDA